MNSSTVFFFGRSNIIHLFARRIRRLGPPGCSKVKDCERERSIQRRNLHEHWVLIDCPKGRCVLLNWIELVPFVFYFLSTRTSQKRPSFTMSQSLIQFLKEISMICGRLYNSTQTRSTGGSSPRTQLYWENELAIYSSSSAMRSKRWRFIMCSCEEALVCTMTMKRPGHY